MKYRWVPARFFRNRMLSFGHSPQREAVYRAHVTLSPTKHEGLADMTPKEYRRR